MASTTPSQRVRRRRAAVNAKLIEMRPILLVIGVLLVVLAVFMLPPLVADLVVENNDWRAFLLGGGITLFAGISLILVNRAPGDGGELSTRQAFVLTTLAWLVTTAFAAVPFLLSDLPLSAADCFFEAMSGLTTTGSTVMVGLDEAPPGILLWRAILQWLGGIGIIVMGVAVLPMLSVGGMQLFRTESSDLSDKILPRAAQIASAIGLVYLALSWLCGMLYWLAGMAPFDAAAHAMTTIATGGFSTSDASIGAFANPAVEWTASAFMLLGGIPFVLYIQLLAGDHSAPWRDSQVRWFLGIVAAAVTLLTVWLYATSTLPPGSALRHASFNTISMITGTGYASTDYGMWGYFPTVAVFFIMVVGGCTGSTTGGIKVFRFVVFYAGTRVQLRRLLQPHGVFVPTFNGRPLPETVSVSVMAFFFLFGACFAAVALILSMLGLDFLTAMSGAATSLANVGPGLGPQIGPAATFAEVPEAAKWVLAAAMLLGRLELFTVLILFTPVFWRP